VIEMMSDGQCGFCVRTLAGLRRMTHRSVFRLHDGCAILARFAMAAGVDTGGRAPER